MRTSHFLSPLRRAFHEIHVFVCAIIIHSRLAAYITCVAYVKHMLGNAGVIAKPKTADQCSEAAGR